VVVAAEEYLLYTTQKVVDPYHFTKVKKVVTGGDSRAESVINGLEALPASTELVAIHDGARPLITPSDIDRVVKVAAEDRAAILATKATDTVKRVRGSFILGTLERDSLYMAQTPQVFDYKMILKAHRELKKEGAEDNITDDASLMEKRGHKVRTVEPTAPNFKVTTVDDLVLAEAILKGRENA
jgi:2-C-methyl-D-erythritol 4-phosphate cytidylyltransferase